MPCPASGTITIQDIVDEFGGSAPHSLSEYYRNGGEIPGNNTNVPESGAISLENFYSAVNEIQHTHSDGDTHANYATIFGSNWASTVPKRVIVPSGVTVGGTTTHAMLVPTGMGGTLVFDISGNVHGHGGAANGGNGGNAIHCLSTTGVTININSGAEVKAGGGGGGQGGAGGTGGAGGAGGTGGAGGMGYYWSGNYGNPSGTGQDRSFGSNGNFDSTTRISKLFCQMGKEGQNWINLGFSNDCYYNSSNKQNPWGYCSHIYSLGCNHVNGKTPSCFSTSRFTFYHGDRESYWDSNGCRKRLFQNGASGGSGGAGGAGGAGSSGGAGGVGQGYNQSAGSGGSAGSGTAGATGSAGASGASGSNSAGNGGSGGTGGQGGTGGAGGNGGAGGAFGASGSSGSSGNTGAAGNDGATGNTGANGNTYNGSAGSAGSSGSAGSGGSSGSSGGTAGYYIYNRASITLNNSGTVAGQ